MQVAVLNGSFADPVFGAQASFRAVMDAFANPGQVQLLPASDAPPTVAPGLASVALTLLDHDTQLWLDPSLAVTEGLVSWLRFQTGAPLTTEPALAQFALASSADLLPPLQNFALGTQEYPDRSTTIVLAVPSLGDGPQLMLRGPGIREQQSIAPSGLPIDFLEQWQANRELFPRGVDLLLVAGRSVVGLPRSVRISEG